MPRAVNDRLLSAPLHERVSRSGDLLEIELLRIEVPRSLEVLYDEMKRVVPDDAQAEPLAELREATV